MTTAAQQWGDAGTALQAAVESLNTAIVNLEAARRVSGQRESLAERLQAWLRGTAGDGAAIARHAAVLSTTSSFGPAVGAQIIALLNTAPTGSVIITGTAVQGEILTASNTLADADGLGPITYQWQADGSDITGATSDTYTLTQDEVGKVVTVVASYTDGNGYAESVASAPTATVTAS
jgi:hypothetical protein